MTDAPAEPLPVGEDEFRMIADSAPVAVWVTRLDRKRSFVNRAYVAFLGVSYQEALDFDWRRIIHPDDAAQVLAQSVAGEASLGTFELEGRYRNVHGEWRWLHSTSQPRRDAQGHHIGFIGVAHDVTEAKTAELALREREAQLSAFISQTTAGFAQVDIEGRFTLVNDRFCEIAGWSRDALMGGMTMQQITHPDDLARNLPLFEKVVRDGTPYTHEKRYVRKDGGVVWVNNSVAVIRRPTGEPFGVLSVTLDVTQRRADEDALRKSEETLRLATEAAGMATWELDLDTMEGAWSPNRFDLLGMPHRPDPRGSFDEWIARAHPDDRAMVREAAMRCFTTGEPYAITYRIVRAEDGAERWLQSHGSRIDYGDGRPSRFVGVSFDVAERQRAEQELRESEARFRTIFEQDNDFLMPRTLDNRVTSVNPAVVEAIGYREDEILGRSIRDARYDLGIDVRGDVLSILVLAIGGVARRVGFAMGGGSFLLTDVAGVLDKSGALLTDLDRPAIDALKADGTITGGMIPKVETCVAAVDAGVDAAVILDGRVPHAMLLEIFTARGAGTLIHR